MKSSGKSTPLGKGFFPSSSALRHHPDPDGVVAIEGDLTVPTLLEAYRSGIFPWPTTVQLPHQKKDLSLLLWFCPPARAILEHSRLQINRTLKKVIQRNEKTGEFSFTQNQAFDLVIQACASIPRPAAEGTWITPEMIRAYKTLFCEGHAHSVEVWNRNQELIGGIYGVEVDGVFSAESMFHRVPNVSKLGLIYLMASLHKRGITWIDIQMMTPHLKKLGARTLSRDSYLTLLHQAQKTWKHRQSV